MMLEATSPAHRAAILMVLLGPEAAGRLLKNLPPELVQPITAEVTKLDTIPESLAQQVLEEYFIEVIQPEAHRGGFDVAREMLDKASLPGVDLKQMLAQEKGGAAAVEVLAPLLETPPEILANALSTEHPQTAALVLLNLTPTAAANVMSRMSDEQRSEAVQRMTVLQRVEGAILDEVAASLQERLQGPAAEVIQEEQSGMSRTAAVLQEMSRSDVRTMLEAMENVDPERAQELRALVNTFDQLALANDRGIQELLRSVETKTLVLALKGEEQQLLDKFMNNLSERAAGMFREEMEFLSEVRPDDKNAAQKEIMAAALELEKNEKLIFEEPAGSDA